MSFIWKSHKDIWKGEGVYFLTFVVAGRRPLLGELVPLAGGADGAVGAVGRNRQYMADVTRLPNNNGLTPNNNGLTPHNNGLTPNNNGLTPHNNGLTSQRVLPYEGWRADLCTSKLATVRLSELGLAILRDLNALPARYSTSDPDAALLICAKQFMPDHLHVVIWVRSDMDRSIRQIAQGFRIGVRKIAAQKGADADGGHFFDVPYIRTLASRGQLRRMIDYVHANPDNAWMRRLHPDLYVIRRNQRHGGLLFDTMGKARLLDYPDRNVVALSRSLTPEQIAQEVQQALLKAERGVVTYCAAINEGEKAVSRAIREAGYPLVVMMLDGFPPEGTEAARYFHPSGVYHTACGEGRLYLMAPMAVNYNDPRLIALTEHELARKAAAKGQHYSGIPHTTKRWRMIAGNMMLQMIATEDSDGLSH